MTKLDPVTFDAAQAQENEKLLREIEAFCERTGMSLTAFGKTVMNDKALVVDLRAGRQLWPRTQDRLRAFMQAYQSQS